LVLIARFYTAQVLDTPDNRWVSFTDRLEQNRARIVIAPLDGEKLVPESAWIAITEEGAEDWADWSPDGKTLYFTSGRNGYTCIWGQRVDPDTHRPAGPAFAALHLHGRASYQHVGWSAAGGRIAIVLEEDKGNVWTMSRPATR
jgi:Tol biopolymer transport system component